MFKTITKKILCGVLALTASFGALATMTGCETSYPEVEIQLEFNGKAYTLEYKLYRKLKCFSSVIPPYGRVILLSFDNSVIESCGFSVILFALKLAKRITLCETQ